MISSCHMKMSREADLLLCFRICKIRFSHDEAHISCGCISQAILMSTNNLCFYGEMAKIIPDFFIKFWAYPSFGLIKITLT